jgi:Ca-activated chloride channel family protein
MPSRPDGAHLTRAELPLNLPAGWDFDKVFGEHAPVTAPRREDRTDAAPGVHLAANTVRAAAAKPRAVAMPIVSSQGVTLPKTATDAELRMMLGVAMVMLSLLLLMVRRLRLLSAA